MINEIIGSIMECIRDSMKQTAEGLEKGIADVIPQKKSLEFARDALGGKRKH